MLMVVKGQTWSPGGERGQEGVKETIWNQKNDIFTNLKTEI